MNLLFGVGWNDLKGVSTTKVYQTWRSMLGRCYSSECHVKQPTYIGCTVCEEWLTFSKFKAWMETQDFEGKCLDKDILFPGNKVYSPETCVFVSRELNNFLTESNKIRGLYPIGVYFDKLTQKFKAQCSINGKCKHLGYFDTPDEAHDTWKTKKLELALIWAAKQTDLRIAKAIVDKYRKYEVGEVNDCR